MRSPLAISILLVLLASPSLRADLPAPTMAGATPEASIPHPRVLVPPRPEAQAGTNQGKNGAPNAGWLYPDEPHRGLDAVRVTVSPRAYAAPGANFIYWAFDSVFLDNQTWYVGLQPNGEFGKTALFSVFGKGTVAQAPACREGADGGAGTHCHIAYPWKTGGTYQFTVALVAASAEQTSWEAAVFDLETGARTPIGRIAVPASRGYLKAMGLTFSEYFRRTACDDEPQSEVLFFRPVGYRDGREFLGKLHSLNANSGCNPSFRSDGSEFVFIAQGKKP